MEIQSGHTSKVAKRRAAKRRKNALQEISQNGKGGCYQELSPQDLVQKLREEFRDARDSGDVEKTRMIRQQIWLAQDAAAGCRPDISKEQLESIIGHEKCSESSPDPASGVVRMSDESVQADRDKANVASLNAQIQQLEKQLRKLTKKQTQIAKLKERLENGEELEKTQISKIHREKDLEEEIDSVEEQLYNLKRM